MSSGTTTSAMEVGKQLVALCSQGKHVEAIDHLYCQDVVSIEPGEAGPMPARQEGIEAIRAKNQWWMDNHEVHGGEIKGPYPHGDQFACYFSFDVTAKCGPMEGKRMQMEEVALYTVKNGKISQEEFFYSME